MAFDYLPKELQRERERPRPLLTEDQVARILEALKRRQMGDEEEEEGEDDRRAIEGETVFRR